MMKHLKLLSVLTGTSLGCWWEWYYIRQLTVIQWRSFPQSPGCHLSKNKRPIRREMKHSKHKRLYLQSSETICTERYNTTSPEQGSRQACQHVMQSPTLRQCLAKCKLNTCVYTFVLFLPRSDRQGERVLCSLFMNIAFHCVSSLPQYWSIKGGWLHHSPGSQTKK